MDENSVRKSHGHHIPPAKGMGERALLLLGLLSLLTAADKVRHADAQHRATSNPSEGHAVKAGEREANGLGVTDGDSHCACAGVGRGIVLYIELVVTGDILQITDSNILTACISGDSLKLSNFRTLRIIRRFNGEFEIGSRGVAAIRATRCTDLMHRIRASIKTGSSNLALIVRLKLYV